MQECRRRPGGEDGGATPKARELVVPSPLPAFLIRLYVAVTPAPRSRPYVLGGTKEAAMTPRTFAVGLVLLLGCGLSGREAAAGGDAVAPPREERPIDLCLCLDTSNSMDGL